MSDLSKSIFKMLDLYFLDKPIDENGGMTRDSSTDKMFMLDSEEWKALDEAWWNRDARWKKKCVDLLMCGPKKGYFLLKRALFDENVAVILTAAYGLSDIVLESIADEEEYKLNNDILLRLQYIVSTVQGPEHLIIRIVTFRSCIT